MKEGGRAGLRQAAPHEVEEGKQEGDACTEIQFRAARLRREAMGRLRVRQEEKLGSKRARQRRHEREAKMEEAGGLL